MVALSSCEAEYIAATTAACQGIWLVQLLGELKGKRPDVINIKIDSQSAIQLSKDPIFHDHSKHTDIRYHYIHECIEENRVRVESIVGVVPNSLQDIGRASDGAKRRPVAGGGAPRGTVRYGIYTLARVSWRLDSLVSCHRRVTQNS